MHTPQPETKTVLRHEVPLDSRPHPFRLTHSPHAIAAKRIGAAHENVTHRVEFWAEHDHSEAMATRAFQVFGTGQPIPASARIVGTTERLDGLVWHLYEIFPTEARP